METSQNFQMTAMQLAVGSIICGILSFFAGGPFLSIPGVIMGHVARRRARNNNDTQAAGWALLGLILSYALIAFVGIALSMVLFSMMMSDSQRPAPFIYNLF